MPARTHGHTTSGRFTGTYNSWRGMKDRCLNPNHVMWRYYGGRGITICDRWLDFANFLADMGERPTGLTLDRFPDPNGNYEPGNARWATRSQQAYHRHSLEDHEPAQIRWLRSLGYSMTAIGKFFDIRDSTVWHIVKGNSYREAV